MAFPKGTALDWLWGLILPADMANVEVGDLKAPTGPLSMNSQEITGLASPTNGGSAVNKDHLDSVVQGLDWQNSVLDELDTPPPGSPTTGDRYLIIATATGDWVGHEDDIAEWNGASWDFITPNKGYAVWIEDVGSQKTYNGTNWVSFGTTVNHGNLTGIGPNDHHTKTGNYEVYGLTEEVTGLPVAAIGNLGRFMRERTGASQVTKLHICVQNAADGYEWVQLGIST